MVALVIYYPRFWSSVCGHKWTNWLFCWRLIDYNWREPGHLSHSHSYSPLSPPLPTYPYNYLFQVATLSTPAIKVIKETSSLWIVCKFISCIALYIHAKFQDLILILLQLCNNFAFHMMKIQSNLIRTVNIWFLTTRKQENGCSRLYLCNDVPDDTP